MGWDDQPAQGSGWVPPHQRPAQLAAARAAEEAEERERLRAADERRALAEAKLRQWQIDQHAYEAATGHTLAEVRQGLAAAAEAREAQGHWPRNPAAEYGSQERPALLIQGDEVRPRIEARRSDPGDFYRDAQHRLADTSSAFEAMRADYHRRLAERRAATASDRSRAVERTIRRMVTHDHASECLANQDRTGAAEADWHDGLAEAEAWRAGALVTQAGWISGRLVPAEARIIG